MEPEETEPTVVNVVYRGQWIPMNVQLTRLSGDPGAGIVGNVAIDRGSHTVWIDAPTSPNGDLKVWTHRLTPEGDSERLPAALALRNGDTSKEFDLGASAGHVIVPVSNTSQQLEIALR